jgi:hypothetical protein
MTYSKLLKYLQNLTQDELNQDVAVRSGSEFFPLTSLEKIENSDVLDDGHIVLM